MADFPTYASVLADGYEERPAAAVDRSQMDDGMVKQLQTKSRVLVSRPVSCKFFSLADKNSFMTWFRTTVHYGADWFNWVDKGDGATKLARIVGGKMTVTPVPGTQLTCWIAAFTLETWSA
jgi:hypothetical protein